MRPTSVKVMSRLAHRRRSRKSVGITMSTATAYGTSQTSHPVPIRFMLQYTGHLRMHGSAFCTVKTVIGARCGPVYQRVTPFVIGFSLKRANKIPTNNFPIRGKLTRMISTALRRVNRSLRAVVIYSTKARRLVGKIHKERFVHTKSRLAADLLCLSPVARRLLSGRCDCVPVCVIPERNFDRCHSTSIVNYECLYLPSNGSALF